MFLFLSKILPQLFMPFGLCLQLFVLSFLILRRRPRAARLLLGGGLVVLWALATPACSDTILRSLEAQHRVSPAAAAPQGDALVVLGGGTASRGPESPEIGLGSSSERLLYALRLYRAGRAPRILLSGGTFHPGETEAEDMKEILSLWGVPDSAMILETRSRNTHENAVESLRIAEAMGLRRLVLLTSAFHMPRALAIFQKESGGRFTIQPAVTGKFTGGKRPYEIMTYLPDPSALANSTMGLREHLGTLIYRARGWL